VARVFAHQWMIVESIRQGLIVLQRGGGRKKIGVERCTMLSFGCALCRFFGDECGRRVRPWLHQRGSARAERPSGAEALVDSAGFVPGMNPRPTPRTSFSGTCEVREIAVRFQRAEGRCSLPGSGFRFVGGWVRLWVIMRGSWAVHCIGPEVQLQVLRLR
jgi:hypothetical protein